MPSSLQCPNCSSRAPEFRHSLFKLGEPSVLLAFKEGHQQYLLSTVLYSQPICATMRLPMTFRGRWPSPALALSKREPRLPRMPKGHFQLSEVFLRH
ncbi:hypothetical protein SUGI_0861640 [Cryptomeria japonica]|nr:hypothetical protein SUGI_0861640 [Cryptomeria japonica]